MLAACGSAPGMATFGQQGPAAWDAVVVRSHRFELRERAGDVGSEVGSIVVDEAQQRGTSRVLPGLAEHVQPGGRGDSASVAKVAVAVEGFGDVDPAVVAVVAGRPDHGGHSQRGVVSEDGVVVVRFGQAWPEGGAGSAEVAGGQSDDGAFAAAHPVAATGGGGCGDQAGDGLPPEDVAPERALGDGGVAGADRE